MSAEAPVTTLSLSGTQWIEQSIVLRDGLKSELQGTNGYWKEVRDIANESAHKAGIRNSVQDFVRDCQDKDIDECANKLALNIWRLNERFTLGLAWDFGTCLKTASAESLKNRPYLSTLQKILLSSSVDESAKLRAISVCQHILFSSITQGNKSNAGGVGEAIVNALFASVGATEGVDYRTQYKSAAGSDTDFVIPAVPDYQDSKVEQLIAVQFSTNDRARLVASELKTGGVKFMFSGNGLEASSKALKDIGDQVVQGLMKDNVRLACYGPGLSSEISRLEAKLLVSGRQSTESIQARLRYFKEYAVSLAQFRDHLKRWCVK